MSFALAERDGDRVIVCRTGYTGEHGYELVVPSRSAPALWDDIVAAVATYGGRPCGLGARDTLRTEMGYPLHGQDLSLESRPCRPEWLGVGWSNRRSGDGTCCWRARGRRAATALGLRAAESRDPASHMR